MPQSQQGMNITDPAQVATGVIGADEIATDAVGAPELADNAVASANIVDDSIVAADINSAAAIPASKLAADVATQAELDTHAALEGADAHIPSTGLVNANVATNAAIVDTKLAQIVTASKVSGAAITLLTSLPSGAGVIPTANLPTFPAVGNPGTQVADAVTIGTTFVDLNLSAVVGARKCLVILSITMAEANHALFTRENGHSTVTKNTSGPHVIVFGANNTVGYVIVTTDSSGIIEWCTGASVGVSAWVNGFISL